MNQIRCTHKTIGNTNIPLQQLGSLVSFLGGRQWCPRCLGGGLRESPNCAAAAPPSDAWTLACRPAAAAAPAAAAPSPTSAGYAAWPAGTRYRSSCTVWSAACSGAAGRGQNARAVGELAPSHY